MMRSHFVYDATPSFVHPCASSASRYIGKERDSESGLDYVGARYYASSMGRFMSPDSIANDIVLANPQTWNRYMYARNNPLVFTDLDGAAVELIGQTDEERKKALAVIQGDVGKEAGSRLYINEVKDGDNTRYFVGINGNMGDFKKLGDTAQELGDIVENKNILEFGLTSRDLSKFGGAATFDKGWSFVDRRDAHFVGTDQRLRFKCKFR